MTVSDNAMKDQNDIGLLGLDGHGERGYLFLGIQTSSLGIIVQSNLYTVMSCRRLTGTYWEYLDC